MSLLKQLDRAARTCWCPSTKYPNLIASGTIAGTIDDSFVTKSQLELYDIDLSNPTGEMRLLGSVESKDCFHSVAWGAKGIDDGSMAHGLIAGGMSDGSVNIWNADAILSRSSDALLSRSEVHKGQVLGLQFHPQQPNLLASGATDGEVLVWDLANLKEPRPSKPNPAAKGAVASAAITSIAWNKNAPQILASASELGETTVWDLRQKRSIITIRNSARINVRASALAWNPAVGVQLAVCYNNYPVAEVFDLRASMSPKVKMEGFHSGSVLGLDWCPSDPSLLLTVGEDARMAAWNPLTGQFLHEINGGVEKPVAFDVQWAPHLPGIISTGSYDGKVNVHSIHYTGPAHVPSWINRPIGASFGFGGKLVSFGLDRPAPAAAAPTTGGPPSPHKPVHPKVQLAQLVTDPEVLDKAAGLQQILKEADFPALCAYKIAHADGAASASGSAATGSDADLDGEKTIWTFMKILFEDESNQRYLLLKELGFEPPASSDIVMPQPSVPVVPNISEDDFFNQEFPKAESPDEGAALGDNSALAAAVAGLDEAKEGKENEANGVSTASSPASSSSASASKPFVEDAHDKAIRQALVFGDFKAAVSKCLEVGRMADAIIFASFGPATLWEETRAAYFAQHRSPFIRDVMKNVSNQSLDEMIATSELDAWRQTLAICITYTTTSKYRQLVNQLAQRLEDDGRNVPAVVCYICSSNIDKAIEMWTSKIPTRVPDDAAADGSGSALLSLHAAIEKIAVFAHATNAQQSQPSKALSLKYAEYANMLASQGELRGAFNYLSRVATPNDPNSAVLLDRIFHAESEQFVREQYPMPPFPFPVEPVAVDPTLAQTLHAQAAAKAQRAQQIAINAQQQAMQMQARTQGHTFQQTPQVQPQAARQPQHAYGNGHMQPPPQQTQQYGHQQQAYGHPPQQQQQYGSQAPPQVAPRPQIFQPQQPQYGQAQPPQQHFQPPPQQQQQQQQQPPQQQQYGGHPQVGQFGGPQQAPVQQPGQFGAAPYQPQQAPQQQRPPAASPVYQQAAVAQPHFQPQQQPPQQFGSMPPQQQAPQPAAAPTHAPAPFAPAPAVPAAAAPAPSVPFKTFQPNAPPAMSPGASPAAAAPAAAPDAASSVQLSPADAALMAPLEGCLTQLSSVGLKTPEQKKVTEIRSKLQELARKISAQELSPAAMQELGALVAAVGANDFSAAQRHHLNLVKTDWANNNEWLLGLKTMLLMAKKYLDKSG